MAPPGEPGAPPAVRVLLVGDFPPPHGGVATHVEVLLRAVRARGGACDVLDIGKGQLPADGVVPAGGPARFAALLASYAARGYLFHVHTSGANPKSWMLASAVATAGLAARRPALLTLHSGLGPGWLAESPLRRSVAGAVAARFGRVVAVSDGIRDALVGCGVAPSRVDVLAAFTPSFLQPGAAPAGFEALRTGASPLFSAMLAPGKVYGHDVLLRAFGEVHARLPAARLALYGIGTAPGELDGLVAAHCPGAAGAIGGFGELSRGAALAVMAGSDVFVRPTLADGDSVSVREALQLGRLVVASRVGNRPPAVRLVPPGDPAALAEGLLAASGELATRPLRAAAASESQDCLHRLLSLYGFAEPARARSEDAPRLAEDRCAASAAS